MPPLSSTSFGAKKIHSADGAPSGGALCTCACTPLQRLLHVLETPFVTMVKKVVGYSDASYITLAKAKKATSVFKEYFEKKNAAADEVGEKKKKKIKLDLEEDHSDAKVILEVIFKRIPLNKTTFINRFGPLPYPWKGTSDSVTVCLLVKDLEPKKDLPDRELDLENTREHYREKLLNSGLDPEFIQNRLVIMPMRQLMTEFKEHEAKNKLAMAYDVFLADRKLMRSKFSTLKNFLGSAFWVKNKKVPSIVDVSSDESKVKESFESALDSTCLFISGRGSSESVIIGLHGQSSASLAYNLIFVLQKIKSIYNENVSSLSLKLSSDNSFSLPLFYDLASPNQLSTDKIAPRTAPLEGVDFLNDL